MRVRTRACPQAHRCSIHQTNTFCSQTCRRILTQIPKWASVRMEDNWGRHYPWEEGFQLGISAESRLWSDTEKMIEPSEETKYPMHLILLPGCSPGRSVASDDQRCLFHLGRSGMPYTCLRAQSADISEFGFCSSNSAAVKPWVHYVVALPYPYLKNNVTENVYLWPITRIK